MDAPEVDAFAAWLAKRNIDVAALQQQEPEVFARWQSLFGQVHPDSFLNQIRFELNAVRRAVQSISPNAETPNV
jgi:hypothetical protein